MSTALGNGPVPPREPPSQLALFMAAIGVVLLPLSLFFDWYLVDIVRVRGGLEDKIPLTGWRAFEVLDAILVLLALAGTYVVMAELRRASVEGRWALFALGTAAIILVGVQLLGGPPTLELLPFVDPDESLRAGSWIGLAGAVLLFSGGTLGLLASPRL